MFHGLMLGKALTNGHERVRLIAHQMGGVGFDLRFDGTLPGGNAMSFCRLSYDRPEDPRSQEYIWVSNRI